MYNIKKGIDIPDSNYLRDKLTTIMSRGIKVRDLGAFHGRYQQEVTEWKNKLKEEYGILNPASPKQVVDYIKSCENEKMQEICCVDIYDDKWTTDANAMQQLDECGFNLGTYMLEFRKADGLRKSIMQLVNNEQGGVLRPEVSLLKTNRINYTKPALMNIPKEILWDIVKPLNDGDVIISADIKNQEPSILINMLGNEELLDALKSEKGLYEELYSKVYKPKATAYIFVSNKETPGVVTADRIRECGGGPLYYTPIRPIAPNSTYYNGGKIKIIETLGVATRVGEYPEIPDIIDVELENGEILQINVKWEEIKPSKLNKPGIVSVSGELVEAEAICNPIERREFKTAWNAMTYGGFILDNICKNIDGDTLKEYFSNIKEFKEYKSNCNKLANKGINKIKTYFGTLVATDKPTVQMLKRSLMDLPIQGTAADILSLLVKHIEEEIEKHNLGNKLEIYYTRHDEIVFNVNREYYETGEAVEEIRRLVEHQVDNWVPFKVEIKECKASIE